MAGEIQVSYSHSATLYALIINKTGQFWSVASGLFTPYLTAEYLLYTTSLTEQGSASAFYEGTFPGTISAGTYSVMVRKQTGGSAAETDQTVATGNLEWNGSAWQPRSDNATSGQLGTLAPLRLARGVAVPNFQFFLVSTVDHVSPLSSGVISGQIARDGGSFVALQSGAFTEVGLGAYSVQALTSGDLLCNTASLVFTGVGISGGASDPRRFSLVMQRSSGQL